MPLEEKEWERFKAAVESMFDDVSRDLVRIAIEAEALRRIPEREDAPARLGLAIDLAAETVGERVNRIERRLRLFARDVEDLRGSDEL